MLTKENVTSDVNDEALSMIIYALGDSLLRAVHNCSTAKEAWHKLHDRSAGKTLVNKLCVLNGLLNIKLRKDDRMGDHFARMEIMFSRLMFCRLLD